MNANDVASFIKGYNKYMAAARFYYSNGEPSPGIKKYAAAFDFGTGAINYKLAWDGIKLENKAAWSDPVFVGTMILTLADMGVRLTTPKINLVNLTGTNYTPVASQQATINNLGVLDYLNKLDSGDWIKVYEAGYLNGNKTEVHYFLNKNTGSYFDSKVKTNGWSSQFTNGNNKVTGH
ncbi:hypothetical protein D3C72_1632330 [compost metagenome]